MIYRGYTIELEKTRDEIPGEIYVVFSPSNEYLKACYCEEDAHDFIDNHKRLLKKS